MSKLPVATKQRYYKTGLSNLDYFIYLLYSNIRHEQCLGNFPESQSWILEELDNISKLVKILRKL